jgi:hypothetical protein
MPASLAFNIRRTCRQGVDKGAVRKVLLRQVAIITYVSPF